MPAHNAGKFLVPAIESILKQTYPRFELLIVDDGSTDTSWKTIRDYRKRYSKRIRAFRTAKQLNAAGNAAMDIGLSHAKGVFIARMDADDIAYPKRLEKQVEYLLSHPRTILVGTQATVINRYGKIIGIKTVPIDHEAIYGQFGIIHPMIHPTIVVRRSLLPNPNKLYLNKWGVNDDYYSFFKLLNYGEFANLPECLLKYRVHEKNASLQNPKGKFTNSVYIRLEAIQKFNYQMSSLALLILLFQLIVVGIIPERFIVPFYMMLRGMTDAPLKRVSQKLKRLFRRTLFSVLAKTHYTWSR